MINVKVFYKSASPVAISFRVNANTNIQSLAWSLPASFLVSHATSGPPEYPVHFVFWHLLRDYELNHTMLISSLFSHLHLSTFFLSSSSSFNTCIFILHHPSTTNHVRPNAMCSSSPDSLWMFLDWKEMHILPQTNKLHYLAYLTPTSYWPLFCTFAFTRFGGGSLF